MITKLVNSYAHKFSRGGAWLAFGVVVRLRGFGKPKIMNYKSIVLMVW
ncbi:MAG: hypothetical protein GF329_04320 [Candidatus Lokiarchaeota archaeon]|nr:hypothetical protein [Candidatus Lokiarchaeota archaeon]